MIIGIVDIGISNTGSLSGILYNQGWDIKLLESPDDVSKCTHLILPGVGTFFEGMQRFNQSGMSHAITDFAKSKKPILGICLGMQLLASFGDEGGGVNGLSLIPGRVKRLDLQEEFRIPHIGWNTVDNIKPHPLTKGLKSGIDFYFVHSYHLVPDSLNYQFGTTSHGEDFCSCVGNGNVFGVQFHPEKSQRNGIILLNNFCNWSGNA